MSILLSFILFLLRNKNKTASAAFVCSLALLASASSFCTKAVTDYLPALELCNEAEQTISGTLSEYENSYDRHYYTIKNAVINGNKTSTAIRVCSAVYQKAEIDDILTFASATVYELGASNGNTANYKADNIYLGAYTTDYFAITQAEKHSINYYLNEIREYISDSLSVIGNDTVSSVAVAMLTGDKSEADADAMQNFRYSGISHLFAVSGFHLTLWTSAIAVIFDKVFKKKNRLSAVFSIIFVLFFMALTGFTKSVMRAGIMMLVLLFGRLIKRNSDSLNSLFLAVSLILLINPYSVMSISLQLSFLSTFGILLFTKPLQELTVRLEKKIENDFLCRITSTLCTTLIMSVVAALFTLPVCAISLNSFSLCAPITNILCLSVAQLMMMLSALAVIFSPVAAISKPLLILVTLIAKYILFVTEKIAQLRAAVVDTSSVFAKIIFLAATVMILVLIFIFRKNQKRLNITLFASYTAVIVISLAMLTVQNNSIRITAADVGNGTSIVLNIKGNDIIIGCGGSVYKEHKLTNAADTNTMEYDLLIIPRNTKTESAYMYTVLDRYDFDSCICCDADIPVYALSGLPENTRITDNYTLSLDENCNLVYINNDSFSGVRIESDGFSCTIIFRPTVDFSSVDESWQTGSLLITRQAVPDIDLSGFEKVIVSTSADKIYDSNSICTTKHSGQITYRMYPSSFTIITEANNDFK
ncbi:MAG: ComEC/Rec2 family competence protein [Clostridia bacterium]|nr:ComEC/Rec2 family competence protein [Clostridia bacterium]